MPLPTTGAISLAQVQAEFGGANPVTITEYYRGGGIVSDRRTTTEGIPTNNNIPPLERISLADFRGKSGFDVRLIANGSGQNINIVTGGSVPCPKRTILVVQALARTDNNNFQPAQYASINGQTGRGIFRHASTAYDEGQAVTVTVLTVPTGNTVPVYLPPPAGSAANSNAFYAVFAVYSPMSLISTDSIYNTDGGDNGLPRRSNTVSTPSGSFVLYIAQNNGGGGPGSDLTGKMTDYVNTGMGIGFDFNPNAGSTTYSYAGNEPKPAFLSASSFYKDL